MAGSQRGGTRARVRPSRGTGRGLCSSGVAGPGFGLTKVAGWLGSRSVFLRIHQPNPLLHGFNKGAFLGSYFLHAGEVDHPAIWVIALENPERLLQDRAVVEDEVNVVFRRLMNASTVSAPFLVAFRGCGATFRDRESLICITPRSFQPIPRGTRRSGSGRARCTGPSRDAPTVRRPR